MRTIYLLIFVWMTACISPTPKEVIITSPATIPEHTVKAVIDTLLKNNGAQLSSSIQKGVNHVSTLWRNQDGNVTEFAQFCKENFVNNDAEKLLLLTKLSKYFESILGHFNKISLDLRENVDLNNGPMLEVDKWFSAFSVGSHLQDDLYKNKIAFVVALNFPFYTMEEKEQLGKDWNRTQWAYARMGDLFVSRVPAEIIQKISNAESASDIYISEYNIQMGSLRTNDGRTLFPKDMSLLTHWNLRDEIKANYANKENGIEKQEMIYQVMQRIINQEIPSVVINNPDYFWLPYTNKVLDNGKEISVKPEENERYRQILENFHAQQAVDPYQPDLNTLIKRKFSGEMEIPQEQVEALFDQYLKSPELIKVGKIISQRLGRPLKAFDIWYDGFKARSSYPQDKLNQMTTSKYPNPGAFASDMVNMLIKLGWNKERAQYIAEKIAVDPARGSGHAWGAAMKGEKSHLRTRIALTGMDYKGYNIAVHEFGHNVEQTISLYDVDSFMMNGVPNTAFTEALAFIFQSRDLKLLGLSNEDRGQEALNTLDATWSLMEIMGVGMLDMKIWKWLYAHPAASAEELKIAVITISKEVWNSYFAPVFGIDDQPILAIYSHMISNPLYLANYSYGQIIEFQIEDFLKGKNFSEEIDRIFKQGKLIPQLWMESAVGKKISVDPILKKVKDVLPEFVK